MYWGIPSYDWDCGPQRALLINKRFTILFLLKYYFISFVWINNKLDEKHITQPFLSILLQNNHSLLQRVSWSPIKVQLTLRKAHLSFYFYVVCGWKNQALSSKMLFNTYTICHNTYGIFIFQTDPYLNKKPRFLDWRVCAYVRWMRIQPRWECILKGDDYNCTVSNSFL